MITKNQMKLSIMSVPENVAFARVTVAAFASQLDFTLDDLEEIKVAVSEAVSNCIIHGYNNDNSRTVEIICSIIDDSLEIVIEDTGKGIENIEKAMQPAFSTESTRMGLGFTFMQSFMNNLNVKSEINKGTKVTMIKRPAIMDAVNSENN